MCIRDRLGVLPIEEALAAAAERGLDLVEVAPMARPPVVKIMDYGKFKFEQAKQARAAQKKQHVIHLKEVKYRPGIDDHDFDFKTRHAREFLGEGNKVKVTMMFRGRQIAHTELGKAVLDRVAAALARLSPPGEPARHRRRRHALAGRAPGVLSAQRGVQAGRLGAGHAARCPLQGSPGAGGLAHQQRVRLSRQRVLLRSLRRGLSHLSLIHI